jgi:hypothetical protein
MRHKVTRYKAVQVQADYLHKEMLRHQDNFNLEFDTYFNKKIDPARSIVLQDF